MEVKINFDSLKRAIHNNPAKVKQGALVFMRDSINTLWRGINNTPPWRLGSNGGGVPVSLVRGGNLRKSHNKEIQPFESKIWVNEAKAPYAKYVHGGTYKMSSRPWLSFIKEAMSPNIRAYQQRFLKDIVEALAKK